MRNFHTIWRRIENLSQLKQAISKPYLAFIFPDNDKYRIVIDFWDGKDYSNSKNQKTESFDFNTLENAEVFLRQYLGKQIQNGEVVVLIEQEFED